jgi:hypothetical protein
LAVGSWQSAEATRQKQAAAAEADADLAAALRPPHRPDRSSNINSGGRVSQVRVADSASAANLESLLRQRADGARTAT